MSDQQQRGKAGSDESRIRDVVDGLALGYRSKDARQVVVRYAPDLVMFGLAPPLSSRTGDLVDITGGRKVDMTTAAGLQTWMDGFGDGPFDYELSEVTVAADDAVAFVHALARMGSPGVFAMWFRLTLGLRKFGGEWRISHLHASTPFYMDDTRRAAVDLEP